MSIETAITYVKLLSDEEAILPVWLRFMAMVVWYLFASASTMHFVAKVFSYIDVLWEYMEGLAGMAYYAAQLLAFLCVGIQTVKGLLILWYLVYTLASQALR